MPELSFEIRDNGNTLRVTADDPIEFAEYIQEHEDDALTSYSPNTDQAFQEMTESYWTNGWGVHTADELGQMSECLVISEESYPEEDGSITLNGKVWTNIRDYQIVNPLDSILENGYYDFDLWEDMKMENFRS